MIYQYVVTLKNKQTQYLDITGFLLSFISVLFFILEMFNTKTISIPYLIGSVFILGLLSWNIFRGRIRKIKVYYSRSLLIAALVWMKMPFYQWLSFVFILLALLEYQAKYSIEIGFSDSEILMNTIIKKKFKWTEFSNIVLKDGILTLDFANNKIWQREVEDDEEDDTEEIEFNNYCKKKLSLVQVA